jgi:hypothetical protein
VRRVPVVGGLVVEYPRSVEAGIFCDAAQEAAAVCSGRLDEQYDFSNLWHMLIYTLRRHLEAILN